MTLRVLASATTTETRSIRTPGISSTATFVPVPRAPGPVAHGSLTVIVFAVLDAITRYWPAPVPSMIRTIAPERPPWAVDSPPPLRVIVVRVESTAVTLPPTGPLPAGEL